LFIITLYGLLDDKWDLNPYLRFCLQVGVALIPVLNGVRINFATNPFTQGVFSFGQGNTLLPIIFSVCWIVFLMNILNMGAKGVDGQLSGVVTISALVIAVLSQKYSADIAQWPVIILSLIVAGAFLGLIPWNIYPQKIMPSFYTSNIAGFMLAILSILSTVKVGTLLVTLGIPIIDTFYVMARRILAGKSPVWGDRGHLHHRLMDAGINRKNIAYLYWASTAILGMIALNLNATSKIYTIIGIAFFLGGLALFFKHVKN
jgi:UDP-GlcNAc:undecaprenyl-phosphate GlcNAc-1-phosphate transferase